MYDEHTVHICKRWTQLTTGMTRNKLYNIVHDLRNILYMHVSAGHNILQERFGVKHYTCMHVHVLDDTIHVYVRT